MIKIRIAAPFAFLAAVASLMVAPTDAFADEAQRLVATSMQDEAEQLPQENLAWYSSTKREKRVRIALREQSEVSADRFANLKLSVVDKDSKTREFPVDESGFVTIDEVEPGAHAMVVTGDAVHSATVVYFKEQPDDADAGIEKPIEMSAMKISDDQLLSLVDNYLGGESSREFDRSAYNDEIQATFNASEPFDYQVRLSENGTLAGQVITVMRAGTEESNFADTNIVLLKNGRPVARAVTDATGKFFFDGVRPGVHGLIAAGRAGYAAFAFEAVGSDGVVQIQRNASGHQFVANMMAIADVVPVLLIPAQMVPEVVEIIEREYAGEPVIVFDDFGAVPISGGLPPGAGQTGTGTGGGGAVGGGLGGFVALGGLGAAIAASTTGDSSPSPISPNVPLNQIRP